MAEPSVKEQVKQMVGRLEGRAYKTFRSRVKAHERLSRRSNSWNASLIALATSTTIASVGLLVKKDMYGSGGDALMVVLAILSLVASLVVSGANYGPRAKAMEGSYKRIQQISLAAENFLDFGSEDAYQRYLKLQKEYDIAVESSENHADADYYRAVGKDHAVSKERDAKKDEENSRRRNSLIRDMLISLSPYITLIVPVGLLIPFARWFIDGI